MDGASIEGEGEQFPKSMSISYGCDQSKQTCKRVDWNVMGDIA
jgi:hypothetical protein